MQNMHARYA